MDFYISRDKKVHCWISLYRHEKVHLFVPLFGDNEPKGGVGLVHKNFRPFLFFLIESWRKLVGSNLFLFWGKEKSFTFHEKNTVLKKRRRPKGRSPFFSKSGSSHEKELKCETFCSYPQKRKRLLSPTSFSELSIKKKGREFSVHSDFFPFKILYKYLTFRIRFQASLRKKAHVKIHL